MLYKLARAIYLLPYSTADIERTFSIARIVKNTKRNKLGAEKLEACLLAKKYFAKENSYFTQEMINLYNKKLNNKDSNYDRIGMNKESLKQANISTTNENKA